MTTYRQKLRALICGVIGSINHLGEIQTGKEILTELSGSPSEDLSEESDALLYLVDHMDSPIAQTPEFLNLLRQAMEIEEAAHFAVQGHDPEGCGYCQAQLFLQAKA